MFQRYVANVSYGCCKSRSRCCTYCNGCARMLQALILNISSVFSDVCCKCVYLDVTYIFTHMMQVFYLDAAYVYDDFKCFFYVFTSVSDTCFKRFVCFQTYVAIVVSGCFTTKSNVASLPSSFYCLTSVSDAGKRRRTHWCGQASRACKPHVLASGVGVGAPATPSCFGLGVYCSNEKITVQCGYSQIAGEPTPSRH
jgi:hypothetical protein